MITDEQCIAIYDEVSRTNITRDVKTPEKKIAAVRRGLNRDGENSIPFGHAMFDKHMRLVGFRQNTGFGYNYTVADFIKADKDSPEGAPHGGVLVYTAEPLAKESARYFASGPEGSFFCDDLELAGVLVDAIDKDDDWTITDLENPHGPSDTGS